METKNREKILLIWTGVAVAVLLLRLFVVSPLIAAWHHRSDHIAELRKSLADGQLLLRRADTIRSKWDHMSTNALSSDPALAERQFFDAFDRWVRESHVTEGSFNPELKTTDDNYSVYQCHASVTGSYANVIRFIYDLESDPLGVQVQEVDLTTRDDKGAQISLDLELSGLLLPPPPSATPES